MLFMKLGGDGVRPRLEPTTCLFGARALRDFGDGFVAILLPVYLLSLGLTPFEVGIVATVSLLGSAFLTIGAGTPDTAIAGFCWRLPVS